MKRIFKNIAIGLIALVPVEMMAGTVKIKVSNEQNSQRQELVEVDAAAIRQKLGIGKEETFVVKNALGQEVGYQLTYDGRLLLDVSVRPCGTAVFTVEQGKPHVPKVFVTGRQ